MPCCKTLPSVGLSVPPAQLCHNLEHREDSPAFHRGPACDHLDDLCYTGGKPARSGQAAARWVESTIHSAVHNLIDRAVDERVDEDELVIRGIAVDQAPMIKRFRPAPRGRAHRIRKRMSHLTVVVGSPAVGVEDELVEDDA